MEILFPVPQAPRADTWNPPKRLKSTKVAILLTVFFDDLRQPGADPGKSLPILHGHPVRMKGDVQSHPLQSWHPVPFDFNDLGAVKTKRQGFAILQRSPESDIPSAYRRAPTDRQPNDAVRRHTVRKLMHSRVRKSLAEENLQAASLLLKKNRGSSLAEEPPAVKTSQVNGEKEHQSNSPSHRNHRSY